MCPWTRISTISTCTSRPQWDGTNDHAWGFDARRHEQGAHWGPEEWDEQLDAIAFLKGKREFTYVYHYGDRWEHRIRIGRIQPARDDRCCPLEDIGGVWGYRESMRAFKDPSSQYREHFPDFYREGATWDPEDANLDARRSHLAPFSK